MRWCCHFWYLCLFRVSLPDMWLPCSRFMLGRLYFTLLEMAADRWMLFKSSRGIEAAAFLCMMKIYIFCIISGVSYSLDMPAISFYSFMIVMSILFIARPWKLDLFNFLAGIIFCICSFKAKPVSLALADIYNCWVFYGVVICCLVLDCKAEGRFHQE